MRGHYNRNRQLGDLASRWAYTNELVNRLCACAGSAARGKIVPVPDSAVMVQQNETGEFGIHIRDVVDDSGAHIPGANGNVYLLGAYEGQSSTLDFLWPLQVVLLNTQGVAPTEQFLAIGFGFPTMAFDTYLVGFDDNHDNGNIIFDLGVRVHGDCAGDCKCKRNIGNAGAVINPGGK